jgi:hypothetical protein
MLWDLSQLEMSHPAIDADIAHPIEQTTLLSISAPTTQ